MSTAPLILHCESCGNTRKLDRNIDPAIPARVVKIEQGHCDVCWNGDFDTEIWLDARGREVSQEPHIR